MANEELLDNIQQEVGVGWNAWDTVDPREIIRAVIKHHPTVQSLTERLAKAEADASDRWERLKVMTSRATGAEKTALDAWAKEYDKLVKKLAKAEAVVEKLPVDAHGNKITLGGKIWCLSTDSEPGTVVEISAGGYVVDRPSVCNSFFVLSGDGYPTLDAMREALAARSEGGE